MNFILKRSLHAILFVIVLCGMAQTIAASAGDSLSIDWYGYFKLDGAWDENLTSHGNFVMWVNPKSFEESDEQFNMTANQTRFGFSVANTTYGKTAVSGKVEFDLYAGVTGGTVAENKPMLQLRHAYFTVQNGGWNLLAGQSWDIVSPLNPATINYGVLWGAGNLGYRRAQVSLWRTFNVNSTKMVMAAGVFRTIGNDLTPTFSLATGETAEGADDGTDAGVPSVQGMMEVTAKLGSASLRAGVSGLWGKLNAETSLGNSEDYESWAAAGHASLTVKGGHGIAGEVYTGNNTGSYSGGILNNSRVTGLNSTGGWASAWLQVTPKLQLGAGGGIDDPDNNDLSNGNRSKNTAVYGNIQYRLVTPVTLGLELSNWETEYLNVDKYSSFRVQSAFTLSF